MRIWKTLSTHVGVYKFWGKTVKFSLLILRLYTRIFSLFLFLLSFQFFKLEDNCFRILISAVQQSGLPNWLSSKESRQCRKQIWSLGWEDTQKEEMATHSSILAWEIPWTEESDGLQSQRAGQAEWAHTYNKGNQLCIYICLLPPGPLSPPPSHCSRSSQSPELSPLCHTTASH